LRITLLHHPPSGVTLIELLVVLLVFSLLISGIVSLHRSLIDMNTRADRRQLALLAAQDLYEEMLSVPYSLPPDYRQADYDENSPRTLCLGSLLAYSNLTDSPIHDVVGAALPWGRGLSRSVRITQHRVVDRTSPTATFIRRYAETNIRVIDIHSGEELLFASFSRSDI